MGEIMTIYRCTRCGFTIETKEGTVLNFDQKCTACMEEGGYTSARLSYMRPIKNNREEL